MIPPSRRAVQGALRVEYSGVPISPLIPLAREHRTRASRAAVLVVALGLLLLAAPATLAAQAGADTALAGSATDSTHRAGRPAHYWRSVAAGFAASLLAHESAHVVTALAVGGRPTFGISKGRPTVYSGLDSELDPRKQFLFSSMGLNVQAALDEGILDVPHARGAPFERGVLLGGIATTLFYVTIGRTASVSDVDFMARTSSLSKTDITVIYGGVAMLHMIRIHRDARYANFFVRPAPVGDRGLRVGVNVQ
jgi:hypothetical protein